MDMPKGGTSSAVDSGAYTDVNRLASLKHGDKDSVENQKKVAREFESLFVSQMLKAMRSANEVLAKDNPMNTPATRQYQDMYDQQLAVTLSTGGNGIGLQDVLMRQLSKDKGINHAAPVNTTDAAAAAIDAAPAKTGLATSVYQRPLWATRSAAADQAAAAASASGEGRNDMAMLNSRRLSLPAKLTDRLLAGIVPSATTAVSNSPVPARATAGTTGNNGDWTLDPNLAPAPEYVRSMAQPPLAPAKRAFSNADQFVETMLPLAKEAAARIGVDPVMLVAQAALETGWGKSIMRQQDGSSSHNLFGIKAAGSWKGAEARAITSEFRDGKMVKETADFRSYDSYADSFHDLVSLLQNNSRYKEVVNSADKPEQFVKELQKAGYATDPDYASKISQIAKQMKSYQTYAAAAGSSTTL
ncbi:MULTISPECIES: flagellar assembly peptidoglycan hydrolase FlgJ [Pseudomonas syringae group]|uniref:Peptidoglycan hydrolase FlgJ n=2 Tax=Pseudomonas syringae group TaxID=136849 RepID=A0A2V4QIZ1_PSESJ|nr:MULTISPECIES: flagellar assembly peptidoglycan hydrolase FlgJ [Pseudomonas syringae group]PYD14822.1 flagellar assembly peptidoglycan hydrolase FlgJ [Pseudomonas syringae pv. pisi]PYD33188.1 flagellar assembly peptidoglycan hydrolase FlgJ [Pseudomonas syringae pv. pisi]RML60171.1 Flagellar rod assembly protein/muramidase FlgJ [Pseudomonas syringae pv. pisi]RML65888.1 Flagellar rod assembly protein/muramidase FlgJ [Pseudomonas syringae pv. pisi]RMM22982.1 Flagellar rod assembly protein/muram